MKKKWLAIALSSALIGCGALSPAQASASAATTAAAVTMATTTGIAAAANVVGEIKASVNFREAPSTSGKRIRYLQRGETVTVIREVNAYWLEIRDGNGVTGFVSSQDKYITVNSVPETEQSHATIVATVSFRTGPSTSNTRIRYLKAGETVRIIENVNAYWFKVADSTGKTGYVSTSEQYIQISNSGGTRQTTPNGQVRASVSFREGPSTNDARIRYLQKGELIYIVDQVNSYWYQAYDSNNVLGYVSTQSRYIDTMYNEGDRDEEPVYVDEPNGKVLKSVSLRTGPSTGHTRIRYLQANEPVWVLDRTNNYWYYVMDKNGTTGYVSSDAQYMTTSYQEEYKQFDRATAVERTIAAGLRYLGTPYEFKSSRSDTTTFDCSDFVRQSFLDGIGMRLPGDSRSQGAFVKESGNEVSTDWKNLKRGDLIFFMDYKGYRASDYADVNKASEKISHVGIYLGNGQILHTYSVSSGGVRIDDIAGTQWEYRMLFGGSPLPR